MDMEKHIKPNQTVVQDDILLAALKLFAEKGYFNTSLSDIKDQAGLKSTSVIYQHYKNKQIIASTLYGSILDSLSISVDDIRRRNKKPVEQLREIVDLFFTLTDEAPEIMQFLLAIKVTEFLPEQKPLLQTPAFQKILGVIQAGIKAQEIRSISPLLAYARFFGVINQTLDMVLSGVLDKQADVYQSDTWGSAWNAIARK